MNKRITLFCVIVALLALQNWEDSVVSADVVVEDVEVGPIGSARAVVIIFILIVGSI